MADQPSSPHPIKTVVILVQENRSFDHMLGWMKSLNPDIDGVTGIESNPLSTSTPTSPRLYHSNQATPVQPDPGHSFEATFEQIYGVPWTSPEAAKGLTPTMEGFVQQAETISSGMGEVVMSGHKPDDLPVFKELVSEFAVCDRWFASIPTLTQPNRLYIHSATSFGATANDNNMMIKGYPQKTIFESLEEGGCSFGIYYQYPPSTLFFRNLRKLKYIDNFHQFDLEFERDCKKGKLPNYVVIEQRYFGTKLVPGNDDHPPHDVADGQRFVKKVYEALRSSPQWNEILFVIIYDEHGGFYDHVPTPVVGIPSPDGIQGPDPYKFQFDHLGVRVPAILVSPWIERGTVLHGPSGPYPTSEFEHSSIPATVKKIFNLKDFLTKRDAWAGTFEGIASRSSPRTDCPEALPEPINMRDFNPNEDEKLSEFQEELVKLASILKGDQKKDTFPDKLLEKTVFSAVDYMGDAFQNFYDRSAKARREGKEETHIVCSEEDLPWEKACKSFGQQLLSCLICDH